MLTAIIVAGGSSRRMGFDKTFALLANRPVIAHSIAAFERAKCVGEIVLVARTGALAALRSLAGKHRVVEGGAQRQDSVAAGLATLREDCEFVAVHDAARPLIQPGEIAAVYEAARKHGGAALAAPVNDTLKRADEERFVAESIERAGVWAMQTPQIFRRDWLEEAYARVAEEGLAITDEVSALQRAGRRVFLVENTQPNLKITYPADLAVAEWLLGHSRDRSRAE